MGAAALPKRAFADEGVFKGHALTDQAVARCNDTAHELFRGEAPPQNAGDHVVT
jgi:hypothetical protein